jgi:hypothetical protein
MVELPFSAASRISSVRSKSGFNPASPPAAERDTSTPESLSSAALLLFKIDQNLVRFYCISRRNWDGLNCPC